MKYSMSIAMVAILLAAAFVGVVAMDDEADAVASYSISIDGTEKETSTAYEAWGIKQNTDWSNAVLGNDLKIVDGKITGTVVKAKVANSVSLVKALWPAADDKEEYMFMVTFSGLTPESKIVFIPTDATITDGHPDKLKAVAADSNGVVNMLFKSAGGADALKSFEFIITASASFTNGEIGYNADVYSAYNSYNKEKIEFDIEYLGTPIEVRYSVGDYTCIQKTNEGKMFTLASLEALNASAPSGKKFIGWTDGTNTYSVGTVIVFGANTAKEFTAVFEALPEAVITFVDGTSTLKSINVSDLSEKTVPSVEKTGYTFDGWFMGDVKVDPLTYTFEESVTLVAQWTPINCYVTFVAGDFVKTVPVLYGDRVQAPALPDGFEKWNFDFSVVITDDLTIAAIEKAPEKPTGLADPTVKMAMVIVGLFVCVLLAVIILKREDIRAGMVRKLSKAEDVKEDKKE